MIGLATKERGDKRLFILILTAIMLLALTVRLAFFNGPFGSDEIVYLERSLDVAHGDWSSANYNGALRYGYNIPSGFIIYLFGLNLFTANLWPLLCSLAEVAAVFVFAWTYMGRKSAVFSALFLAFTPLHVAVSTRLHADPVVSLFLTLSFIVFYQAERKADKSLYFWAGILLGCVFWVKELLALAFFAFLLYPLFIRKLKSDWLYLVLGGLVMLLAHFALMQAIAGDPLHAFKVVLGQIKHSFIGSHQGEDTPLYYFKYLFFDIKHTWLAPLFALLVAVLFRKHIFDKDNDALKYTVFWLLSLLLVLSFFPVSLSPLRFAMKQSNYITLFLAPIALLAGAAVSRMPTKIAYLLCMATVSGGFALSALEQQDYQLFTANSRGLLAFADKHPGQTIYGSLNNGRIACFYKVFNGVRCSDSTIHEFAEMPPAQSTTDTLPVFTVIDRQNLGWGSHDVKIDKAPACWQEIDTVTPASIGNSHYILDLILAAKAIMPASLADKIQAMQTPKPAKIYTANAADLWCGRTTTTNQP